MKPNAKSAFEKLSQSGLKLLKFLFDKNNKVGENVRTLVVALFVVMFIRSSIAAPYKIPTGSMIPTLQIGDHIFVSKLSYSLKLPFTNYNITTWDHPKRGDVIVFKFPEDPSKDFIKRVVGLPGDTVEVRHGVVTVNGSPLPREDIPKDVLLHEVEESRYDPEGYALYKEQLGDIKHFILHNRDFYYGTMMDRTPQVVKEGHYFVMGDNRDNSKDSREWGQVEFSAIRGRALVVFLSFRFSPFIVRWDRFGKVIK